MIAISSTSSYGWMMIATFGYKQKYVFLWMTIATFRYKQTYSFLWMDDDCHFGLQTEIPLPMDDDCHFWLQTKIPLPMDDDCHFWLQTKIHLPMDDDCHFWLQTKIHLSMDNDCHFGYKQKFLFKKKSALACFLPSFLPLRALHCIALHPPSLALILAPALRSNLATIPLSFPFLTSSRSYTFSPHKPTIPPCVSNLISKLVLEAFPFPISKIYNLSWIFLFCLFACVCVFCLGEFAVVADSSRQREKKSSSSSSVCVCVCVLVTSRETSLKRQDG